MKVNKKTTTIERIKANKAAYRETHFKTVTYTLSEEDKKMAQACADFIRKLDEAYEECRNHSTLVFRTFNSTKRR